ncbi:MAG: hypothetical protein ABS35_36325 [Kaistia sp. SCN 65-12]|nr:MAG: hypothetical protein ABS35_36325 [Kaistia sp. SCN 65-12]
MNETELYRAKQRAPIAGKWREAGEEFRLTRREADAEGIWGVIEKVERRAAPMTAKKGKARNG